MTTIPRAIPYWFYSQNKHGKVFPTVPMQFFRLLYFHSGRIFLSSTTNISIIWIRSSIVPTQKASCCCPNVVGLWHVEQRNYLCARQLKTKYGVSTTDAISSQVGVPNCTTLLSTTLTAQRSGDIFFFGVHPYAMPNHKEYATP